MYEIPQLDARDLKMTSTGWLSKKRTKAENICLFLDPERQAKGSYTVTFFVSCQLVSQCVSVWVTQNLFFFVSCQLVSVFVCGSHKIYFFVSCQCVCQSVSGCVTQNLFHVSVLVCGWVCHTKFIVCNTNTHRLSLPP